MGAADQRLALDGVATAYRKLITGAKGPPPASPPPAAVTPAEKPSQSPPAA